MKQHWTWLEPLGYEDGFGESLLSMYRRVAFTFSASLLEVMREACVVAGFPDLPIHLYSENINGCGWPTRRLLRALSSATGRIDLARATLADATGLKGDPFRPTRAWCPECVAVPAPFAPLLWSLRDYVVCMRHLRVLQSRCGKCHRQERHLLMRSNPVECAWCGAPLSAAECVPAMPTPRTIAVTRALRLFHDGDFGSIARAPDFAREFTFGQDHARWDALTPR